LRKCENGPSRARQRSGKPQEPAYFISLANIPHPERQGGAAAPPKIRAKQQLRPARL
jgi:hypothetical protein